MIEYVQFFPTLRCNKNCEFCFNRKSGSVTLSNYDFPRHRIGEFVTILKENNIFNLDILGGEPFLYEPLEDLVKLAIENNIEVTISTNGTLLEKIEKFLKIYRNSKLHIGVSINGKAKPELLHLIEKNKLWIKSVITKNHIPHEEILKFAKNANINYYLIYMDAITEEDLKSSMPFYEFMEFIEKLKIQYPNIQPVYCRGFTGQNNRYRCPAAIEKITVMPDGAVYPCYLLSRFTNYYLGNIFERSLVELMSSDTVKIFENFSTNICNNKICKIREKCHGGCVAHSIIHYGTTEKADPRCNNKG